MPINLKEKYRGGASIRADKYIAAQLPQLTRAQIQRAIRAGGLIVSGQKIRKPSHKLEPGDRVEFILSETAPRLSIRLKVRYESQDLLILEKPAGVSVFPDIAENLIAQYPQLKKVDASRAGIVHRLDKDTSGLLLAAKNNKTYEYLKKLFRSRAISKGYLALVSGRVERSGVVDRPLTKIGFRGQSRVRVSAQGGRQARTEYRLIKSYEYGLDQYSLLQVKLHTGRTHQIRVHLASIGHPVMGDKLYGKPHSQKLKDILPRQFLHASRLEFQLPDGTWIDVESELPEDLQEVVKKLERKNN